MDFIKQYGWHFLLAAVIGETVVPFILAPFYKGYRHTTMAISVLGHVNSPVRLPFNLWMLAAGLLFLLATPAVYHQYCIVSKPLTIVTVAFIGLFAVGACILSCFFSVNETKDMVTTASQIHGAGSAIGFMLLLFVPLFLSLLAFDAGDKTFGRIAAASFVLAVLFFVLFVMADKARFQQTIIAKEGLWQRLSLLFMYVPLVWMAVRNIL